MLRSRAPGCAKLFTRSVVQWVVIWWDESTECLLVLMRRGIANLRGLDLNELQNALYDRLCYRIMAVSALVVVVKNGIFWCSPPGFCMSSGAKCIYICSCSLFQTGLIESVMVESFSSECCLYYNVAHRFELHWF